MTTTHERLTADGWKQFRDECNLAGAAYCKRFETPTRCAPNSDREGAAIILHVSRYADEESFELQLHGGLPDQTAFRAQAIALGFDLDVALASIPRLLAAWECYANYEQKETDK